MDKGFSDSELVLGLVGAVGTQLPAISSILKTKLEEYGYSVVEVHVTKDVIPLAVKTKGFNPKDEYQRIEYFMNLGNWPVLGSLADFIRSVAHPSLVFLTDRVQLTTQSTCL